MMIKRFKGEGENLLLQGFYGEQSLLNFLLCIDLSTILGFDLMYILVPRKEKTTREKERDIM